MTNVVAEIVSKGSNVFELLDFDQIEAEYGTPTKRTAYVWSHHNRYGFRDLIIKVGSRSKIRCRDFEQWLERRGLGGRAPMGQTKLLPPPKKGARGNRGIQGGPMSGRGKSARSLALIDACRAILEEIQ